MLPVKTKLDVLLFCVTPVTLAPMTELIVVVPEPVPELVIVPALLTLPEESVMPPVELSCRARLYAPVTPPLTVKPLLLEFDQV